MVFKSVFEYYLFCWNIKTFFCWNIKTIIESMVKLVEIVQWGSWIVLKSVVRSINNNKNKLNSEIILIFNVNPNAHY